MAHYDFTMPISEAQARALRVDDTVTLNGTLYGIRDATQIHMFDRGRKTRFDLAGHAVIHTAPNVRKVERGAEHPTGYEPICIGTTTSDRMERFTRPLMQQYGVRLVIGKGGLRNDSLNAFKDIGGAYLAIIGGMAAMLSKYVPGIQATAEVTGGSVANLQLIATGKPYLGMTMADATLDAYKGEDKFKGKPVPVRTLLIMYPNRMHVVTIEGTGINTMKDLKGKRVSTGSGGSATEVMAFRVIEAAGLDKDRDMKRERLGVAESVNAIKDRKIDAFFWVGGLPTAAVTDIANTPGVKLKLVDHADLVPAMNKKHGELYVKDVIAKDVYHGMERDNHIATVNNLLVAHEKMDADTAYKIVNAVVEKRHELAAVHAEARNITLENQSMKNSPIPWHPGAVKYLAEQGVKM